MAKKSATPIKEIGTEAMAGAAAEVAARPNDMYTVEDFAQVSPKLFGVPGYLVQTALSLAGKDFYTEQEAKKIIESYKKKEVKK